MLFVFICTAVMFVYELTIHLYERKVILISPLPEDTEARGNNIGDNSHCH